MRTNPLISVVIPTYNRKNLVNRLIKSLLNSSYKNIEIIVIDDASQDGTSDFLKNKYKNNKKIRIFTNKKNLFASGSKNEGLKKAKGEFIAFIDDDNIVDERMLEEYIKVFKERDDIGELGPINYNFNKKNAVLLSKSTRNMWTTKTTQLRTLGPFKNLEVWEADDVSNSFIVRADVVRKNKITFNKNYGIMYEESDFAYKIRQSGYKVYMVRKAKIYHDIENILGKKPKDYLFHFMTDSRRPFTFARNRILFHNTYSNNIQKIFIYLFWVWFFSFYYCYKFIFYKGYGEFGARDRIGAAVSYMHGTFNGFGKILVSK